MCWPSHLFSTVCCWPSHLSWWWSSLYWPYLFSIMLSILLAFPPLPGGGSPCVGLPTFSPPCCQYCWPSHLCLVEVVLAFPPFLHRVLLAFPPLSAVGTNLWVAPCPLPLSMPTLRFKPIPHSAQSELLICIALQSKAEFVGENVDLDTGAVTERPPLLTSDHQSHCSRSDSWYSGVSS